MENQIVEFKNVDNSMFVRLEKGEIYGDGSIFVAFWKKSESAEWNKQGSMPMSDWDAQIAQFEKLGMVKI